MAIFSLITALLLEQLRPFNPDRYLMPALKRYARFFSTQFNGGQASHGTTAWVLAQLLPLLLIGLIYSLLASVSFVFAFACNVAVLYVTLGFRQFSHYYTDIHAALKLGELDRARLLLGQWRGKSADTLSSSEVSRLTIEQGVLDAHRHVFAVVVWFVLLPGPLGAVLYRMADYLAEAWRPKNAEAEGESEAVAFASFSGRALDALNWLPVRVTAAAFAVMGNFEDAVFCWRNQAQRWANPAEGILLASAAGALGVRLGLPVVESGELVHRAELGTGEEADAESLQSGIGLIWRTLVLTMVVLTVLGVVRMLS